MDESTKMKGLAASMRVVRTVTSSSATPGEATVMSFWRSPDGKSLPVRLPAGFSNFILMRDPEPV